MSTGRLQPSTAPAIDVVIGSPLWDKEPAAAATVERAIAAAASELDWPPGEVAVMLTDDETIRGLNRDWRKIDQPTNVLSFPNAQPSETQLPLFIGNIAIAYETMARESAAERKDFHHHLAHLSVHGFLHLIGYDHETDSGAEAMEGLETAVLARLGIPDPYLPR